MVPLICFKTSLIAGNLCNLPSGIVDTVFQTVVCQFYTYLMITLHDKSVSAVQICRIYPDFHRKLILSGKCRIYRSIFIRHRETAIKGISKRRAFILKNGCRACDLCLSCRCALIRNINLASYQSFNLCFCSFQNIQIGYQRLLCIIQTFECFSCFFYILFLIIRLQNLQLPDFLFHFSCSFLVKLILIKRFHITPLFADRCQIFIL